MLLLLSVLPGIVISLYIFFRDRFEPEPKWLLMICFAFGALSTVPAVWLERRGVDWLVELDLGNFWGVFLAAFAVVAFCEELVKLLFLRTVIYPRESFNEPMDGIVYAVVFGMGFATWENVQYVMIREGGFAVGLLRMFTAVPAHAAFGTILGYFLGLAKHEPHREKKLLLLGFLGALLSHGAYDFFIFQKKLQVFSIAVLAVSITVSFVLIGKHRRDSFIRSRRLRSGNVFSEME